MTRRNMHGFGASQRHSTCTETVHHDAPFFVHHDRPQHAPLPCISNAPPWVQQGNTQGNTHYRRALTCKTNVTLWSLQMRGYREQTSLVGNQQTACAENEVRP